MIYKRRSVRKYKQDRIPQADILKMIEAANVAPSAKNRQPWRFIVYSENDKKELLNAMEKGIEREIKVPKLPESASGIDDAKNTLFLHLMCWEQTRDSKRSIQHYLLALQWKT